MELLRKYSVAFAAFCIGFVMALSCTVFSGSARARDNDYKIVKSAAEVVELGEEGWQYIGLAPGGQTGIMKK